MKYSNLKLVVKMYRRLRDLREDNDLTQQALAEILNVEQTTYSKYERGVRDIPTEVLIQLADFYNTTTDYLLGRIDNPAPYPKE